MARKVQPDHFVAQFESNPAGHLAACYHAAYLLNSMYEQTERYENELKRVLDELEKIPGVTLAINIHETLYVEEG